MQKKNTIALSITTTSFFLFKENYVLKQESIIFLNKYPLVLIYFYKFSFLVQKAGIMQVFVENAGMLT